MEESGRHAQRLTGAEKRRVSAVMVGGFPRKEGMERKEVRHMETLKLDFYS